MDRKVEGFSLIELLVVIAIIAILMSVGIPSFLGWIGKEKFRKDLETIKVMLDKAKYTAFHNKVNVTVVINGKEVCIVESGSTLECTNSLEKKELSFDFPKTYVNVSSRGYFATKTSIKPSNAVDWKYNCVVVSRFRASLDRCN